MNLINKPPNKFLDIQEEVWLIKEKPNLTKRLFNHPKDDFFSSIASSYKFTDYAYSAYLVDQNNIYQPIIGWTGSAREVSFIGQTDQFKSFIKNKIPVGRKRLAFFFSLFTQSFQATTNTLSIFSKQDDQTLVTDELFRETDGLVMWRYQMEELFQYVGFTEKEARKMQKEYQQRLRKETAQKLRQVKIDSLSLYEILKMRVPPKKASILNYSTSKFFYDYFVKPKLN